MEHFDQTNVVLPYRLRKKPSVCLVLICLDVLLLVVVVAVLAAFAPILLRGGLVSAWIGLPALALLLLGLLGLFAGLGIWPSITLCPEYLVYRFYWVEHKACYKDMHELEVSYFVSQGGGSSLTMWIHHTGKGKSPFELNLATFKAKELVLLLNVIHKLAPDAVLNEVSAQIKAGNMPRI